MGQDEKDDEGKKPDYKEKFAILGVVEDDESRPNVEIFGFYPTLAEARANIEEAEGNAQVNVEEWDKGGEPGNAKAIRIVKIQTVEYL